MFYFVPWEKQNEREHYWDLRYYPKENLIWDFVHADEYPHCLFGHILLRNSWPVSQRKMQLSIGYAGSQELISWKWELYHQHAVWEDTHTNQNEVETGHSKST